jgi:hypothetical protein
MGGGGGGHVTRRWTLKGILMLLAAVLACLIAIFVGARKLVAPVYGGPPIRPEPPADRKESAPVYGGPPLYEREPQPDGDERPNPRPAKTQAQGSSDDEAPSGPRIPGGPGKLGGPRSPGRPSQPGTPKSPDPSAFPFAVYGGPPPLPPEPPQ